MAGARFLYLHGFASGPHSKKGVAFERHFAHHGVAIERLDLRVPSFERLRLSTMIDTVRAAIGGGHDSAILIGSSLGGLAAARVAERDPRVVALVLLAPAFGLVERWRHQLGGAWDDWRRTGWYDVIDRTTSQPTWIDFGFAEDVIAIDVGLPDVRVPTLILHGVRDVVVPIDHSQRFVAQNRYATLVELDDDHELIASLPRLLGETERFVDGLSTAST